MHTQYSISVSFHYRASTPSLFDYHNFLPIYISSFQRSWFPRLQLSASSYISDFILGKNPSLFMRFRRSFSFISNQCLQKLSFRWSYLLGRHLTFICQLILTVISEGIFSTFYQIQGHTSWGPSSLYVLITNDSQKAVPNSSTDDHKQQKEAIQNSLHLMHLVIAFHSFRHSWESKCTINLDYLMLVIVSISLASVPLLCSHLLIDQFTDH